MENKQPQLKDTVILMKSDSHEDQLRAEYAQAMIRRKRLEQYLLNDCNSDEEVNCPKDFLKEKLNAIDRYVIILEAQMRLENVEFDL